MSLKLKENLLLEIFRPNELNKYSKSLLNLKTIVDLEESEGFFLPENIQEKVNKLFSIEHNFINNIPLNIVENYFYKKSANLNSYINIEYHEISLTMKTIDVFVQLEKFYNDLFLLACLIGNLYNLEIKVNTKSSNKYI